MNPIQQRQAAQKINEALEDVLIPWTPDLKEWHKIGLECLSFASAADLQIPQKSYHKLLKTEDKGIAANVVAVIANNIERRTPHQLNRSLEAYKNVLKLNQKVADYWETIVAPIRDSVIKQMELADGVDKGLKLVN